MSWTHLKRSSNGIPPVGARSAPVVPRAGSQPQVRGVPSVMVLKEVESLITQKGLSQSLKIRSLWAAALLPTAANKSQGVNHRAGANGNSPRSPTFGGKDFDAKHGRPGHACSSLWRIEGDRAA
jgi:hypothetical protein